MAADNAKALRLLVRQVLDLRELGVTSVSLEVGETGMRVVLFAASRRLHVYRGERAIGSADNIAEMLRLLGAGGEDNTFSLAERAAYAEQSVRAVVLELGGFAGPPTIRAPKGTSGFVVEVQRDRAGAPPARVIVYYMQRGTAYSRTVARHNMERLVEDLRKRFNVHGAWHNLQYHITTATLYGIEKLPGDALEKGDD